MLYGVSQSKAHAFTFGSDGFKPQRDLRPLQATGKMEKGIFEDFMEVDGIGVFIQWIDGSMRYIIEEEEQKRLFELEA